MAEIKREDVAVVPEPRKQKPKKEYTGFVCGRCRWAIHLNDGRGRCRRNPPSIPGPTPADPCRYPPIDLHATGCGEWTPPPR